MLELYFLLTLASVILFAWLGRIMARRKNRSVSGWAVAAAIFPPVVLILLFLSDLDDPAAN